MLSSLPLEVVSLICSFSDANTFHSFTLTNSAYNQNETLYQEYINKNYSPELFGFPKWDHTVFEKKGFLPNKKTPLRWRDLFYRINSKVDLIVVGEQRYFPIYFNEALISLVKRANYFNIDAFDHQYRIYHPIGNYLLEIPDMSRGSACSYKLNNDKTTQFFDQHQMITVLGSIIHDENCLFDMVSVID
jgi:hypothetical protein